MTLSFIVLAGLQMLVVGIANLSFRKVALYECIFAAMCYVGRQLTRSSSTTTRTLP
jgi:hypothetical protein